ncbi:MAG: efflux RND transporter periplasmic adaptor subunit [Gemmatimonadaceae bacterium]|nr:efflux RND transporter periplasmic adaptor subunit [Gemmatimonadaceae bacterium]
MTNSSLKSLLTLTMVLAVAACGAGDAHEQPAPTTTPASGAPTFAVLDTLLPAVTSADGVATPMREATLSTKLMAAVTEVLVQEGDVVRAGQLLVRLDSRDLSAKSEQVAASVAAAEAMYAQANAHAARMRALFADSAAPKAMLEAAEASLAQAASGLRGAKAAGAELTAVESYAEVRAPFAGRVTQRFVDVGAFAAPGAPLVSVQDASSLRVTAHVAPEQARGLRAGQRVAVSIEGVDASATIEGVVPTMGSLYAVNAIVANRDGSHLAGSAAALQLPTGTHRVLAIPTDALITEGDMVGVVVRVGDTEARRWIRTGVRVGGFVEVTAGLKAGDLVVRRTTGAR